MASRKILVQLDIQAASSLTSPLSGFVGFSAKADGLYQKIGTAPELRLLTSADVQNAILADGSITGAVSQAQIFTMGVKLYNLTQGYIPYASGATKLLSNSQIYTDGTNVGIGTTSPSKMLSIGSGNPFTVTSAGVLTAPNGSVIGTATFNSTGTNLGSVLTVGNDIRATYGIHGGSMGTDMSAMGTKAWNDTMIGFAVRANSATQSADLLQAQNSSGAVLAGITASGGGYYSGNVGIGIVLPDDKLHVIGDAHITGNTYSSKIIVNPTSGIGWYRIANTGGQGGGTVYLDANIDNTNQRLEFTYNIRGWHNSSLMVGSVTVTRSMNYNSGPVNSIRISSDGLGSSYLDLYVSTANAPVPFTVYGTNGASFLASPEYNPIVPTYTKVLDLNVTKYWGIQTTDSINVGENATISGNVGIGTNNLIAPLTIQKQTGGTGIVNAFVLQWSDSNLRARLAYNGWDPFLELFDAASVSKVKISSYGDSYFNATGNVGIGTNPNDKLDVLGKIRATTDNSSYANFYAVSNGGRFPRAFYGIKGNTGYDNVGFTVANDSNDTTERRAYFSASTLSNAAAATAHSIVIQINPTYGEIYAGQEAGSENLPLYLYSGSNNLLNGLTLRPTSVSGASAINVGIGTMYPTASLHIKEGTAIAGTAPLKLTLGVNLTIPEIGAIEFSSSRLYFTPSSTRETVAFLSDITSASHAAVTIGAIGSTPNANGMSISGQTLSLQPASATYGGIVTTGTQTLAGAKTLSSLLTASAGIANNGSYTQSGTSLNTFTGNIRNTSLTASKVVFTDGSKNLTSTGIGTASQFIKGDGSLDSNTYITSGSISGFVPYTGANDNVNLGTHNLSCNEISTASTLIVGKPNTGYSDGGLFSIISPSASYSQLYFYSIDTNDYFGVVEITANPEEGIILRARSNDYSSNSYLEIRHWELGFYTNLQKRLEIAQNGSINAFGNTITSTGGFIGNASTATKLQTARTITIGNQSLSFDGTANLTYTLSGIGIPVGTASQYIRGDLSLATFPTIHTGSGASNRVTFWDGTNSLSSTSNLEWNNTLKNLSVTGGVSVNDVSSNSMSTNTLFTQAFQLGSYVTAGYVLTTDAYGNGTWKAPTGGGVTIGAIGSVPNANGMTISGQTLSLQPASALYGGILTNSTQTISGAKTLSSLLTASAGIANNGSYTQTGTNANTFTGTSTFSNATYSALFTGGNVGIGTPAPNQQLEITQNFRLPSTAGATPYGIIYKDGNRFIHDFNYGNNGTVTTAGGNTFVGINAGNFTMGSTATQAYQGSYNVGLGLNSLISNTTGNYNISIGVSSLQSNTSGYQNTAIGVNALLYNTTGFFNTANGFGSLMSNTTGNGNTANGYQSLLFNTTGCYNTANGIGSLYSNTTGSSNTANGLDSLPNNTIGNNNTALGRDSGRYIANGVTGRTTGDNGLYLGYNSKASADGTDNETVIGYNAIGAGSNKTVIGNSSVTDTYFGSSTGSSKLWASALNLSSLTASKVVFTDGSKNLTSTGIGTASQFIKGDGSLDSNTYLTTGTAIISGSGVDGRITFWNGTNSLSSTSDLEWNNTTKNLGVTGGLTVNDISSNSMSTNSLSTNGFRLIATTTAGYVLTTDANGNGTWQAPTGGGGSYTLPTASASVLGCVKIGSGITISSGVISVSTNYEAPLTFSSGLTRTGNTISFAGSSSYVPYTGATSNVNLGSYIMYANNVILNSDARLKCNIEIIKSKNIDIDYKKYEFKSAIGDIRYGVIAQDLLKIAPELVLGSEKEGYSVKYIDLLIHEIAYLKQEIKKLTGGN